MEEFRCIINQKDLDFILSKSKILVNNFVQDTYTGTKRIRRANNEIIEKEYPTKVTGKTYRFACKIEMEGVVGPTWLEFKWTDQEFARWEIEFEGEIHPDFQDRKNIAGWQILVDQDK